LIIAADISNHPAIIQHPPKVQVPISQKKFIFSYIRDNHEGGQITDTILLEFKFD
jgi:hypothetical protein